MTRVVSLLPSATEIVCALGAFDQLVGVSHECDYPPQVAQAVAAGRLPVLTSARLGPPGPLGPPAGSRAADSVDCRSVSRQIDDNIKELVRQALAVYTVDEAALAACQPDLVLTQDLCEVCAVSYGETCRAVAALAERPVEVLNTHPLNLAGIWADVESIGRALGREAEAQRLLEEARIRIGSVSRRAAKEVARWRGGMAPRVLSLEWFDPPIGGGLWIPEMIKLAGGYSRIRPQEGKTHALTQEQLERMNPEVLVLHPCGMRLEEAIAELPALRCAVPWDDWPACFGGQAYVCDGSAYFSRPGPRIIDSLELLAACIQPIEFHDFRIKYCDCAVTVGPNLEIKEW